MEYDKATTLISGLCSWNIFIKIISKFPGDILIWTAGDLVFSFIFFIIAFVLFAAALRR